jgi:hypothetical protein
MSVKCQYLTSRLFEIHEIVTHHFVENSYVQTDRRFRQTRPRKTRKISYSYQFASIHKQAN